MIIARVHSFFDHSRSSTFEEFTLFLVTEILSAYRANKTARTLWHFSAQGKFMNEEDWEEKSGNRFRQHTLLALLEQFLVLLVPFLLKVFFWNEPK